MRKLRCTVWITCRRLPSSKCLNHNLDPDSMVPSDFTLNHYSTLPLKNSELSRKGSFFTGWPLFSKEIINKEQCYCSFISRILSLTMVLTFLQFIVWVSFNKSVGLESSRDEEDCNLQKVTHKTFYVSIYIYFRKFSPLNT